MNHTKEPWGYGGFYNQIHTEKPVIQDGGLSCAVAYELHSGGEGRVVAIFKKKQDLDFVLELVGACSGLPDPEKNIRELVEHFRACHDFTWDAPIQGQARHKAGERPEECGACHAFAPFKEKK